MHSLTAHFITPKVERPTIYLDFDLLTIQAFLKIQRVEFEKHCECLGIGKDDADRIIRGLI